MKTRTLTIRGVPDDCLRRLRERAESNRRSLNGEILTILERAADPEAPGTTLVREPIAPPNRATAPPLDDLNQDALAAICTRYHITELSVFGSYTRGDARHDSDVDLVVEFAPGMTPGFGIVRVAEALRPVFGGRQVDLLTRRGLSPRLRERVLASARALYAA